MAEDILPVDNVSGAWRREDAAWLWNLLVAMRVMLAVLPPHLRIRQASLRRARRDVKGHLSGDMHP
eukprot:2459178-Lingulodinium_polyedra.AAC.1